MGISSGIAVHAGHRHGADCIADHRKAQTVQPRRGQRGAFARLILYGVFRIIAEFFREPDAHLGFVAANITMGQLLSLLMVVAGFIIFILRKKQVTASR